MGSLRPRPAPAALRRLLPLALLVAVLLPAASAQAIVLPTGFQESVTFTGLSNPTAVRFAADGRVFVAEKNGRIKVFDSVSDSTPTTFADLSTNVYNFWDRGLLGMALAPNFPADPSVYVLYTHDAPIGGVAPRWGTPGVLSDPCPSPPGATGDGCVVSGRLSKLTAAGDVMTGTEKVLIEDWCQQYPSHSVGSIAFGADGALYVTGGDGASFNFTDWGQDGNPVNPCGDPPGAPGTALSPPTAQGGALRAQDLRTPGDPVTADGAVLRIDPNTGAGLPDNPLGLNSDPNSRRVVAHGLRNPFRMTIRPGTSEVWLGDVGWNTWEEINRIPTPTDGAVDNFGWPCREGNDAQPSYNNANLNICEDLYTLGANSTSRPYFTYDHGTTVVPGEACATGSSSISGLAFYTGGNYPDHNGGLFFADYSRDCIWFMRRGANGLPDPAQRSTFGSAAANPVDLQTGPGGDVFYADFDGGTIRRIRYTGANQAPTAVAQANTSGGPTPLTVSFSGTSSTDPEGAPLSYAWDLDDDGAFDDSTSATPTFTYTQSRAYSVRLRVTDPGGAIGTDVVVITAGTNTAPAPAITSPAAGTAWKVGDAITFTGTATDAEDGELPASALSWQLVMNHCPSNCHSHPIQEFDGVAGGSFTAPDHEYPSYLELKLTATDSSGAKTTTTRPLNPQTVELRFEASTPGLQISAGAQSAPAPFTATVIVGSSNSISAASPQTLNGRAYSFGSWSDGGAQTHNIVAPATATTYRATFQEERTPPVAAYGFDEGSGTTVADASGTGNHGTISGAAWSSSGRFGKALSFDGVDDRVVVPDSNALDLTDGMTMSAWVRPSQLGTKWRTALFKAQTGNHVYALYANQNTTRPIAEAHIGGAVRQAPGTAPLSLDAWAHLAMTYDGSTLRMFVDGTQVAATAFSGSIATSSGELWVGGNPIWPEWFAGLIDEVRVYNRALGAAELQDDMARSVGVPDAEPPTPPTDLTATGGRGKVTLDWTAATDNVGVHHYNVHRGTSNNFAPTAANRVAQPTGSSYTDSGLTAGTYFYRVIAEDAAGNVSPASTQISGTATADTTPPTVSITSPSPGATVNGTVTLTANAADDESVASVQFVVDGSPVGAADTTAPYSVDWDSRSVANGAHAVAAVARDPSLNTRTSDSVGFTVQNSAAPPPTGLVAEYGLDDTGTSAADNSGSGNNGAIEGATSVDGGRFGKALSFDGVNDKITVPDSSSLDLTTGMTLEAWVRPTAAGSRWRTALAKESGTNLAYALYANRNTNVPNTEIHVAGKLRPLNGVSQLPLDQWSHLAGTYDGSAIRLFVNGAQVATVARTGPITTSAGPLSIGGNAAFGEWFQGLIDEVRVYNRALSATELQADMARSIGTPDTEAPTTPGTLSATGGLGHVKLDWGTAADNVGIRRYNVHRSTSAGFTPTAGNRIAQPTGTAYTDPGLAPGTYHYLVTAEDAAGNVSTPSNPASGTATPDTTAPTVSLTAPNAGATLADVVTLSATAADNDAVQDVQFKVDGADVGSPDATAPYSMSWDTRTVPNGDRDITAVARDRAGNATTSSVVRVRVANAAAPPNPDLVAAYGFDEGNGSSVRDESGKANGGSVTGAAWVSGRYGSALDFDGTDDWVTVPDSDSLDLTTGMTVSAWVRPDTLGAKWRTVVFKERTGNMVYSLYANESTNVPIGEVTTGTSTVAAARGVTSLPVLGSWSHLAVTHDGANLRLYVNGALVRTVARTGSLPTSTGALRIGGNAVWGERFDGAIDEVRVYKKAQGQAEIQADMGRSVSTPDSEAPSAPANLTANGAIGKVTLNWTAASDNVSVAGYDVHRSSTAGFTPTAANRIAQPSGTSYVDSGLAAGTYRYRVVARDTAGNTSPPSNEASGTATADTTPPVVAVTEPASGATVANTVAVRASATDDGAVASVQFLLDGQPLNAEDTTDPWSTSWSTRAVANGAHLLSARARDAAGNVATSQAISVNVDNSAAPPEGLVAGYGFDEASGATVVDASANNNGGTIAGATWSPGGRFGSALSFDGVDDQVTVPDSNSLDLSSAMTVSAWVRPSALGTAWRTVLFKERTGNLAYALYANQNTSVPIGEVTTGTTVTGARGTAQLPLNAWRHLATTYDGSNLRLFVDGVQVGSVAKTGLIPASTGPLRIGANAIWGERFAGLIDEVRVYERALPAGEIQADMEIRVARDTTAPRVTAKTPDASATDVEVSVAPTVTFSEAMDPASLTASTIELKDGDGTKVPASVGYEAATGKAKLTPASALRFNTTYTATVHGGASGDRVKDVAGNALAADHSWSFATEPPPPPVLVVSSDSAFSAYPAEILRAEGITEFVTAEPALLDASYLSNFDVVLVGDVPLTTQDVGDLESFVTGGGNLIAMRPDKKLAALLGLSDGAATLSNAYLKVATGSAPGAGIAAETMQFHGTADRYGLAGATSVATLYSDANTPTSSPAVTVRDVGSNGGQAAAFTYDLARSVVLTRQGNPAFVGQERDGFNPIRTNDLFFGASATDPQPDWVDTTRIHIPQADEQQRLLVNLMLDMNLDRTPLPRFWYLPRGEKAAVVMTGDDHAQGGTAPRFDQYKAMSPPGCSVADWECVRGTSYVYANNPFTDAQAAAYEADGFEVSTHINVAGGPCGNFTVASITKAYNEDLQDFALKYPSVSKPTTERTHCVAWSDWFSQPRTKATHGIRLDTNYYHYPGSWIGTKPGFMTGSGFPMRFADLDGGTVDVFQAATQMTDESGQPYPATVNTLLDRALGPEGYYGSFVANLHTDAATSPASDAVVASAQARGVPIITARQLLRWTDGRNASRFRAISWSSGTLGFTVEVGAGATGLQGMLPVRARGRTLTAISRAGSAVPFTTRIVKGMEYAFFSASAGAHQAVYTAN